MSRSFHGARRALTIGVLASIAALGASASAAQAADGPKTLTYSCDYPLIGPQPLAVTFDAVPSMVLRNVFTGALLSPLPAKESLTIGDATSNGFDIIGAKSVQVKFLQKGTLAGAKFESSLTAPRAAVATSGDTTWNAVGQTTVPQGLIDGGGPWVIDPSFIITLSLFNANDQLMHTLPDGAVVTDDDKDYTALVACTLDPATQDRNLGNVQVLHADYFGPSAPSEVSASSITTNGAALSWKAPGIYPGIPIVRYDVYNGTVKLLSTNAQSALLTGLQAGTTYSLTVRAIDSGGQESAASPPVTFSTVCAGAGFCQPYRHLFTVAGNATLKSLVKGSLNLTGTLDLLADYNTGQYTGELNLAPAAARLTAYGFLPVTAKVAIVPTTPATGNHNVGAVVNLTAKVRIKLPSISLAGISLGGGSGCQTKSVSALALARLPTSETLVGTFSISDLTNCGALTNFVSSLTRGSGNAITLSLSPVVDLPPVAQ